MEIEWERLSEPQADGYDVDVLKQLMKDAMGYEKTNTATDFLNSVCLVPYDNTFNPGKIVPNEEHVRKVERNMAVWPELILSYEKLVDFVIFAAETSHERFNTMYGCSCGHVYFNHSTLPGKVGVFVSMLGTLGSLEALAHEVGHLRLHMAGIHIEDHDGKLLLNGPDELFESPIRKDKPRPMSAVLQAQYSYVMVSDMDLHYFNAFPDDPDKQECAKMYLKMNIPRIAKGHDEVRNNIRLTPEGERFMDGFWRYSDKVIEKGLNLIG